MQSAHPDSVSVLPESFASRHLQEPPEEPAHASGASSVCKLHRPVLDSSLGQLQSGV